MFAALITGLALQGQPDTCAGGCDPALSEDAPVERSSSLSLSVELYAWRLEGVDHEATRLVALVFLRLDPSALWPADPVPRRPLAPGHRREDACGGRRS